MSELSTRELAEEVAGRSFALLQRARGVAGVEAETVSVPLGDLTTEEILEGTIGLLDAALEALRGVEAP